MEVKKNSPYLPKDNLRDALADIKRSVAYRVWRKKLKKFGSFTSYSSLKLLDIGCGPGYFLRCVEKWFPQCEAYGLDIDESLIKFTATRVTKTKLVINNGEKLPFPDNVFEIVCSLQVIEHLENPEAFFKEANRVLKSNGFLITSTPNPAGIPASLLGSKWPGYRYDHISLKSPQKWRQFIMDAGFQIVDDGTTGLTGFKSFQYPPLAFINWIPMAVFGFFPWYQGESYMSIAKKK